MVDEGEVRARLIVAIDGPAGAGKSSSARGVATRLGLPYLDSGALYRAVAWAILQAGIAPKDRAAVEAFCATIRVEVATQGGGICVNGRDVSSDLRGPEVTYASAVVSAFPGVRARLLSIQRACVGGLGVVAEGRDIGTVVFPNADVKFYLDAAPDVRAARRARETVEADLPGLMRRMQARDARDRHRDVAPLKQAHDAVVIDSTAMGLEQVIERMVREIETRIAHAGES